MSNLAVSSYWLQTNPYDFMPTRLALLTALHFKDEAQGSLSITAGTLMPHFQPVCMKAEQSPYYNDQITCFHTRNAQDVQEATPVYIIIASKQAKNSYLSSSS